MSVRRAAALACFMVLSLSACAGRVAVDEQFELGDGQTVVVRGTGIRIRLEGVGHGWYADGRHFPLADLAVTYEGETETATIDEDMTVGDYTITLLRVDEMEDTCTLRVTRK